LVMKLMMVKEIRTWKLCWSGQGDMLKMPSVAASPPHTDVHFFQQTKRIRVLESTIFAHTELPYALSCSIPWRVRTSSSFESPLREDSQFGTKGSDVPSLASLPTADRVSLESSAPTGVKIREKHHKPFCPHNQHLFPHYIHQDSLLRLELIRDSVRLPPSWHLPSGVRHLSCMNPAHRTSCLRRDQ